MLKALDAHGLTALDRPNAEGNSVATVSGSPTTRLRRTVALAAAGPFSAWRRKVWLEACEPPSEKNVPLAIAWGTESNEIGGLGSRRLRRECPSAFGDREQ